MDDGELYELIHAVTSRLTGNPDRKTRETLILRDIARAELALSGGTEREKREAAAALRVWV